VITGATMSPVGGRRTIESVIVLGVVFIGVAVVLVLMDWNGLSTRMPTQVPPRGLAAVPLVVGVALVAAGFIR
jgi:hypothetical protein